MEEEQPLIVLPFISRISIIMEGENKTLKIDYCVHVWGLCGCAKCIDVGREKVEPTHSQPHTLFLTPH